MIRLSIIIPFYNVEKYIAECLDSVYDQDIPEEEYEVICVNDGSPDRSREIVLGYMERHPNLRLIEHECNRKLGAARNTGRRAARGKYIWNVDSDDMIVPNCLGKILETCTCNDLDVFVFRNHTLNRESIQHDNSQFWPGYDTVMCGYDFWKCCVVQNPGRISAVWTQVYRKEFLDREDIWSYEINMGEDVPYTYLSVLLSERIMSVNDAFYIWRDNSASLTGQLKHVPKPEAVYENSFVCGKAVYKLLDRIPKSEREIRDSIFQVSRYVVLLYSATYSGLRADDKKQFSHLVRKHFHENLFVFSLLSHRQQISYLLLLFK